MNAAALAAEHLEAVLTRDSRFDPDWYARTYPEVAAAGMSPARHFARRGARGGYRPNRLFDPAWYRSRYPEVAAAGLDPWLDFATRGETLGHRPNPLFHTAWYRAQHTELADSERSPLAHYLEVGAGSDAPPNPLFDPAYYRGVCGEETLPGGDALAHFLEEGSRRGLSPHPLFDPHWYGSRYARANAKGGRGVPSAVLLAHFLDGGGAAGCSPHPLFDAAWYLEQHPEVARDGGNPLLHYLEVGAARGDWPHPLFDASWYEERHPAARGAGGALLHFATSSDRPDLQPSRAYDPVGHVARNPGTRAQGRAPFVHFAEQVLAGGEDASPAFRDYARFFRRGDGVGGEAVEAHPLAPLLPAGAGPGDLGADLASLAAPAHPEVSVIVPVFDAVVHTLACLRSVAAARTDAGFEVIVADDASPSVDYRELLESTRVRVLRQTDNQGFLRTCNAAAGAARGRFLVFLNNDTTVTDGWLDALRATFEAFPRAGIAGSRLLFPSGTCAEAGGIVWRDGSAWNYGRHRDPSEPEIGYARPVDYVSGASLMIERELFGALGGFDERYSPAYYEDTDLAFRARAAGRDVIFQPASEVFHLEGASSGVDLRTGPKVHQVRNRDTFFERFADMLISHAENGTEPHSEKDRYSRGDALVIAPAIPTATRDARSLRLSSLLCVLRDLDYRVSFVAEDLGAPEPFRTQLASRGIRVLSAPHVSSIEGLLEVEGSSFELCLLHTAGVARRWRERVRVERPDGCLVVDSDDAKAGDPIRVDDGRGGVIASGEPMPPDRALLAGAGGVRLLPRFFESSGVRRGYAERSGVFVVTPLEPAAEVDALLWLALEVAPRVLAARPETRFYVRATDVARGALTGADGFELLDEARLARAGFLDGLRLAVAPARIGAAVAGPLLPALSAGMPCIATSFAARRLEAPLRRAVPTADAELAAAIVALDGDSAAWTRAAQASRAAVGSLFGPRDARRVFEVLLASGAQGERP